MTSGVSLRVFTEGAGFGSTSPPSSIVRYKRPLNALNCKTAHGRQKQKGPKKPRLAFLSVRQAPSSDLPAFLGIPTPFGLGLAQLLGTKQIVRSLGDLVNAIGAPATAGNHTKRKI